MLKFNKILVDAVSSTNDELNLLLKNNLQNEGLMLQSLYQSKGRGQMGTSWFSSAGKNLLFSIYLKPKLAKIEHLPFVNMTLCLSALFAIKKFYPEAQLKWPNDILCNQRKIAGILVETSIQNTQLQHVIAGFGINVNEPEFPHHPQAVSLLQLLGHYVPLEEVLQAFCEVLYLTYNYLQNSDFEYILNEYNHYLYGNGQTLNFRDSEGYNFKAKVLGVNEKGLMNLLVEGQIVSYAHKEITWVF